MIIISSSITIIIIIDSFIICIYIYVYIYIYTYVYIYIYIYICIQACWRDAVRGARWGLEYPELLRDIWASELTSLMLFTGENVKTCSG